MGSSWPLAALLFLSACSDAITEPPIASVTVEGAPAAFYVGQSAQLSATARDGTGAVRTGRSVSWDSSDSTVLAVSNAGVVRALRVGGPVTISVRVNGMTGATTVSVFTLSMQLSADSLQVGESRTARLIASDASGTAGPAPTASTTWSSSASDVVRVTDGILLALRPGRSTISAVVGGVRTTREVQVVSPDVLADSLTLVRRGSVSIPAGLRGAALTVYSGLHGAAPVDGAGTFEIKVARKDRSLVHLAAEDRLVAFAVAVPGESTSLRLDAQSSAVALVMLAPTFSTIPPALTRELRDRLAAMADVQALGRVIEEQVGAGSQFPAASNTTFRSALQQAVRSANALLNTATAGLGALTTPSTASGVQVSWTTPLSATASIQVQNRLGRDVTALIEEADSQGRPIAASAAGETRYLGIADFAGSVTSLTFWLSSIAAGSIDIRPDPVPFQVTFTPDRPRYVLLAYGLGVRDLPADVTAISARSGETARALAPVALTALTGIALPVIEAFIGVKLLGTGSRAAALRRTLIADPWVQRLTATQLSVCLVRGSAARDASDIALCMGDVLIGQCIENAADCGAFVARVAALAGFSVTARSAAAVLNKVNPLFAAVQLGGAFGTLAQTAVAAAQSELRQEFSLSYNTMLGATRLVLVSGDRQSGPAGSVLAQEIVMRVEDAQLKPVPNAWVSWTVTGGGSTAQRVSTSDVNGEVRIRWTLGSANGQSLEGRLVGTSVSANALATVAQTGGTIRGQVRNAVTNVVVPGAQVSVVLGSTAVQSAVTAADGEYQFTGLAPNTYRLVATATGFRTNSAENVRIVTLTGGDVVLGDFALPPNTSTQQFGSLSGRVLDASGAPIGRAVVTLSGGVQTNGVFRATQTATDGTFAFAGVVLTDDTNRPITSFALTASADGFLGAQRTIALIADRLLTNQDLTLLRGTVATFFTDGFEAATAWTATGLWNRSTLAGVTNSAFPAFVQLAPNDVTQGRLPLPATGSWAFWYGSSNTGNFIGTQASGDRSLSGGTSTSSNAGMLTSPLIVLPTGQPTLQLRFDTWFEIESVNPKSSGYDIMEVQVIDGTTVRTLGRLNPFVDPTLSNRSAIPFTSGGFNIAPLWRPVAYDLSTFAGRTVQIRFSFRTVDSRYNGFRGWLVDNVSITNSVSPAVLTPLMTIPSISAPPPRRP